MARTVAVFRPRDHRLTLSGPATARAGQPVAFTVALGPTVFLTSPMVVTLRINGVASFVPPTVTLTNATRQASASYTPAAPGVVVVTAGAPGLDAWPPQGLQLTVTSTTGGTGFPFIF